MNDNLFLASRRGFPAHLESVAVESADGNRQPASWRDLDEESATIANFKVLKRLFVVEEPPRNAMGKVQKALLRDRHRDLF